MKIRFLIIVGMLALASVTIEMKTTTAADTGFTLADSQGKHLDILLDGRVVARYMYEYDTSTPEARAVTYKPYLHVFDSEGREPITKGPGGEFTHHRGIFIGWRKIHFQGKDYDRWHMKGGEIVHQKFLERQAGGEQATFTVLNYWNDAAGKPILDEQRTMTFRRAPNVGRVIIDFQATIQAKYGDLLLDGDPEHAGVQYRPSNDVDRTATLYVFPSANPDAHKDLDYPWVGETYTLKGKRYSVVDMNHPDNPKNTKFSAYRNYGRFGAFFSVPVRSGKSLTVKYRFLIADGEMPPAKAIQKCWDAFAGVADPSPIPKLSAKAAEQSAAKAVKPKTLKANKSKKPAAVKNAL